MDDETGELIQEDDLTGAGRDEHEIEILGWGWRRRTGVDSIETSYSTSKRMIS